MNDPCPVCGVDWIDEQEVEQAVEDSDGALVHEWCFEEDYVCEHCGVRFLDPAAYDAHDCPALAPGASYEEPADV